MGIFDFVLDTNNYESRKVAKDEARSGIIVSTAYTSDEGYETALLDDNGVHPIERYLTKEEAVRGHAKWLEFAHDANGKIITMLGGFGGIVPNSEVILNCK